MNTDLWVQTISKTEAPAYPCPHCGKGILVIEKQSLQWHPTIASLRAQPDEGWFPEAAVYSFSCWLKCASPKCRGFVAVVGDGHEEADWDDEHGTVWEERFRPKFAWPMPPVFPIPDGCPDVVVAELRGSFAALWSDHAAAASRLRVALEHLLDVVGIGRKRRGTAGYKSLSLHERIEVLSNAQPAAAANLMAIKWLGNTGSHESAVPLEDLLKAYEIMEHQLDALLGQKADRAAALAKDLTRRHARKKRKK